MINPAVTTTDKAAAASTRQVNVRLFAHARELAGSESVCVTVAEQATIGELRHALVARFPVAAELLRRSMFAIDSEYVADEVLVPGDSRQIACIPPVSGG